MMETLNPIVRLLLGLIAFAEFELNSVWDMKITKIDLEVEIILGKLFLKIENWCYFEGIGGGPGSLSAFWF